MKKRSKVNGLRTKSGRTLWHVSLRLLTAVVTVVVLTSALEADDPPARVLKDINTTGPTPG
jgi:hypothetical protein